MSYLCVQVCEPERMNGTLHMLSLHVTACAPFTCVCVCVISQYMNNLSHACLIQAMRSVVTMSLCWLRRNVAVYSVSVVNRMGVCD